MKVRDLKAIIDRFRDDDELVVPIQTMAGSVGPKAVVSIKAAITGNDWDRGKVMFSTDEPLHIGGEVYAEERKRSRDKGEALAFIWMSMSNKTLDDKQKLNAIRNTIKRFGFNVPEGEAP